MVGFEGYYKIQVPHTTIRLFSFQGILQLG